MKLGILGGSFNPPHLGHLVIAESACMSLRLDAVLFVPCNIPPHKSNEAVIASRHRLIMTALAIAGNPRFKLYAQEIERGGVSYTVDTLRQLHKRYPRSRLYLLMGADLCTQFSSWKEPAEIKKLAQLVVVTRQGHGCTMKSVVEVGMPRLEISSSLVRQFVKEKRSIRYLVPDKVKKYIEQKRFYR